MKRADVLSGAPAPLANWLICAALNDGATDLPYVFTSDPTGSDGIIYDRASDADWPTEHIGIMRAQISCERRSPNSLNGFPVNR
jgi:hypothetical protein